jgi:PAS domain S-box-containing protein
VENRFNKTEELLFKYFDNTTDGIIVHNSKKKIIYYNKTFCELSKFKPNQIIDKSVKYCSFTLNNLVQFSYKSHKLVIKGNMGETILYELEHHKIVLDDETYYVNKISLNISLKTQDKTHKSIMRFAEEIPDSVVIINFDGKILYTNNRFPNVDLYLQKNISYILDTIIESCDYHKEIEIAIDDKNFILTSAVNQDLELCNFYAKDITPRKIAEKLVFQSEERFKKIALVSGTYVWETDKDLNITYISKLACDLHNIPYNEFIGKNISELAHEEDRDEMQKFLTRSLALNSSFTDLQYRTVLPNKETIWFYCSGSPLYNTDKELIGLSGVSLDFTKTRNQTIALSETYDQISRILSKMKSGIILVNSNNRIKHINTSFTNLFNIKNVDDVLGAGLYLVLKKISLETKNPLDFISSTIKQLEDNVEIFGDVFEMKNGKYLERDFQPIYKDDILEGYLWSYRNITDRINYEKQLEHAKKQAETANKLKSQFISNVSHEIRTPMNGIFGLLQILQKSNPTTEQKKYLETLRFSANSLLEIINDLLDIHKIEAGKMNFDILPFSLDQIIINLDATYSTIAKDKGLYFKIIVEPDLPNAFIGDATRLGQIINNLVSNAFKFTSKGGVSVEINSNYIDLDNLELLVSVIDTGIGVAQDKQDAIFESFNQGELDTTRIYGGTGLGLSICKSLVEIMGGTISVESERGKGSKFYFKIPLQISHKTLPSNIEEDISPEQLKLISQKTVLLVEDNKVNQLVIEKLIDTWGCNLVIANDGQEAVDIIRDNQCFDIILMDLKMPRKNGYEATFEIRNMEGEYYKNIPIVALTASAMQNEKDKLSSNGMTEHLTKPFEIQDLLDIFLKHLVE